MKFELNSSLYINIANLPLDPFKIKPGISHSHDAMYVMLYSSECLELTSQENAIIWKTNVVCDVSIYAYMHIPGLKL